MVSQGGTVDGFKVEQIFEDRLMAEALKDRSMVLQKEMLANHFAEPLRIPRRDRDDCQSGRARGGLHGRQR